MLSWRPHSNAYSIFLSHLSKVLRLPQKSEVPHLWHKIILANLMIWCSKRHPSGNLLPDLQKMTASYVSWTARATWTACLQILPRKTTLERPKVVRTWCVLTILTSRCLRPTTAWTFWTSQRPKVVWDCQCLTLLWSKCATACIFSTSQLTRALQTRNVFNQPFDFQICFAPQPRALFQRLTTQWFQHFDFQMCFAPQPHAVFKILTWKCASRHNSVHFLNISTFKRAPSMRSFSILTSKCTSHHSRVRFLSSTIPKVPQTCSVLGIWLRNLLRATAACIYLSFQKCSKRKIKKIDFKRCFAPQRRAIFDLSYDQMAPQLLFDPPEPQNNGKNTIFRDCSTYLSAHLDILSTDPLSLLTLSLLCFSDCSHHKLDF